MSLLIGTKDNIKISYQLPLRFDDQIQMISQLRRCVDMQIQDFDYYKVWKLIEKDVTIEVDDNEVWRKGTENTENSKGRMLKYGISASKIFSEQFMVFIEQQGVQM